MENILRRNILCCLCVVFLLMGSCVGTIGAVSEKTTDLVSSTFMDPPIYPAIPHWISSNPHYSTGAALADINQNGLLDIIIADGNDMVPGRLNVYYNNNGSFSLVADWQSDDLGYNGHLDVADVNGDGWPDVAVSYLGRQSSFGPIARLYLNNNGVLSSVPDWSADISGNAFGVAFGDMNNDGRPDLAVATGWAYSPQHEYHNYVYMNYDGVLESTASWQSDDMHNLQGVLWVDADNDGWLDLVGIGAGQNTMVYRNLGGMLETSASWQTLDSGNQDGIMITAGDVNGDGLRDLFTTDNIQLTGDGRFKQYLGLEQGFFETTNSWNYYDGYGSALALADVNGNGMLDLATGAWWDHTRIFLNTGDGLPSNPSWSSGLTSVVEKIVFGDVGPKVNEFVLSKSFSADGSTRLFYLPHQPIQTILSVTVDGELLDYSEYTFNREHGWFTISTDALNLVEVEYTYSKSLDMLVSNWDSSVGNFLYYNQFFEDNLECNGVLHFNDITPGSIVSGTINIQNIGMSGSELDWEIESYPSWGTWTFTPISGTGLTPEDGEIVVVVEIVAPQDKNQEFTGEVVIINSNNQYDFCSISVSLTTPLSQKNLMNNLQVFQQREPLKKV
ncbi:MAG: VCBS repeat-containing protein [Thermoplasmatota archaeon]